MNLFLLSPQLSCVLYNEEPWAHVLTSQFTHAALLMLLIPSPSLFLFHPLLFPS